MIADIAVILVIAVALIAHLQVWSLRKWLGLPVTLVVFNTALLAFVGLIWIAVTVKDVLTS